MYWALIHSSPPILDVLYSLSRCNLLLSGFTVNTKQSRLRRCVLLIPFRNQWEFHCISTILLVFTIQAYLCFPYLRIQALKFMRIQYVRFPLLRTRTCVLSILAFSIRTKCLLLYLHFPYLRFLILAISTPRPANPREYPRKPYFAIPGLYFCRW